MINRKLRHLYVINIFSYSGVKHSVVSKANPKTIASLSANDLYSVTSSERRAPYRYCPGATPIRPCWTPGWRWRYWTSRWSRWRQGQQKIIHSDRTLSLGLRGRTAVHYDLAKERKCRWLLMLTEIDRRTEDIGQLNLQFYIFYCEYYT